MATLNKSRVCFETRKDTVYETRETWGSFRINLPETVGEFEQGSFDIRKPTCLCSVFPRRFLSELEMGTMYRAPTQDSLLATMPATRGTRVAELRASRRASLRSA